MPKGIYKHNQKPWKGKKRPPFSELWKKRMGDAHRGENGSNWKGGIYQQPDYHYKKNKEWVEKNRSYKNWLNWQRVAKKRQVGGSHTFDAWETLKAQYNWTCPACGKQEPEIRLSEDHIIPISKGGSDNIENIQPLCRSCNSIKHTKTIKY